MRPVVISVPVRDEAASLPALVDSLEAQLEGRSIIACFYFDGCTDGGDVWLRDRAAASTMAIRIGGGARAERPNAGKARGGAMALGLASLGNATDGLLLTTDADSVPAPDWVTNCRAALAKADVVAGRIVRQPSWPSPVQDRLEAYYDRLYALRRLIDPVTWEDGPTHHATGGANLGFRQDAYRALGGFAPLPRGEDARIVDDAGRAGLRVRRDAACVVQTSSRRTGRAVGGLAAALHALDGDGDLPRVGHPADVAWQYHRQADARAAFGRSAWGELAPLIGITADHAFGVARDCPNAEAFAMRIVPAPPGGVREVGLDFAEAALAMLEAECLAIAI